jgi:hypothetical protein
VTSLIMVQWAIANILWIMFVPPTFIPHRDLGTLDVVLVGCSWIMGVLVICIPDFTPFQYAPLQTLILGRIIGAKPSNGHQEPGPGETRPEQQPIFSWDFLLVFGREMVYNVRGLLPFISFVDLDFLRLTNPYLVSSTPTPRPDVY